MTEIHVKSILDSCEKVCMCVNVENELNSIEKSVNLSAKIGSKSCIRIFAFIDQSVHPF